MSYSSKHAFHSISSNVLNMAMKTCLPRLGYFDLKNGASNCFPDFYEDLKEIAEYMKSKIGDIISKCKRDFAQLSAFLANGT